MLKVLILFISLIVLLPLRAQDTLTILFAGDAMLHQAQLDATRNADATFNFLHYFSQLKNEITAADVAVVNLEVPLGGAPYSGYPAFCAPDQYAVSLKEAGFDLFLLANNHCLDKGNRGLVRTHAVLDSLGVKHTGTYLDQDNRQRRYPLIIREKDFRIVMLNYTYGTNGVKAEAPRMVNYIDKEQIAADIAEAKLFNPDFIIANMHWGIEYKQTPSGQQTQLANWLLQEGVALVIGSHPHVVQPIEMRQDSSGNNTGLVVYSLGNFISNMSQQHTDGGIMLKATLCRKGLKRYIASASYALLFVDRYKNDFEKEDLWLIPAATRLEKQQQDSLPVNYRLEQYVQNTRSLFGQYNKGVEEYKFE